jgi:hypothetical protein
MQEKVVTQLERPSSPFGERPKNKVAAGDSREGERESAWPIVAMKRW